MLQICGIWNTCLPFVAGDLMEQCHREAIEKIMSETDCSKDYMCWKNDFKNLPHSELLSFADPPLIVCKEPGYCRYRYEIADHKFCTCTLRKYIAQHFNI